MGASNVGKAHIPHSQPPPRTPRTPFLGRLLRKQETEGLTTHAASDTSPDESKPRKASPRTAQQSLSAQIQSHDSFAESNAERGRLWRQLPVSLSLSLLRALSLLCSLPLLRVVCSLPLSLRRLPSALRSSRALKRRPAVTRGHNCLGKTCVTKRYLTDTSDMNYMNTIAAEYGEKGITSYILARSPSP